MEYRRLGTSGLKVSTLCLGTMTFGHGTELNEAQKMVDAALDVGVNFIDTANSYSAGESERMVGKALAGKRSEVVLATKFFNPMGDGVNDSGMSRTHIMLAIDESLRRLGTDWIDVYYIHHVDEQTPLEEMLEALDDLVHTGKVRYIACSNYEAWRLATALSISDREGLSRFVCYQPQYSLVVRDIEQELVPLCEYNGIGIVVWSPLAGGFLTGKYRPGERIAKGTRSEESWAYPAQYFAPNADEILEGLLDAAKEIDRPPAQVALAWTLGQPGITSAIFGARNFDHLQANLGSSELELPPEILARLNELSEPRMLYPRSMEKNMVERRRQAARFLKG